MPSIAGVAIVSWLCSYTGDGLRALLFLPLGGKPLDATSLTLLFLYGNLFCYVASYPVLLFHVTRVRDFSDGRWTAKSLTDGYITTLVLMVVAFLLLHWASQDYRFWAALFVTFIFVLVQLRRLYSVMIPNRTAEKSFTSAVSLAFWYAYALARRRGDHKVAEIAVSSPGVTQRSSGSTDIEDYDEVTTRRQIEWHSEFITTYRHLREHGNSAFIFILELTLAALVYCAVTKPGQSPAQQLGAIGVLLALWAIPALFVHLLGQHLERRFSRFDQRINAALPQVGTPARPVEPMT
jgi:hypothetical protein